MQDVARCFTLVYGRCPPLSDTACLDISGQMAPSTRPANPQRPTPLATAHPCAALDPDVPAPDAAHVGAAEPERGNRAKAR